MARRSRRNRSEQRDLSTIARPLLFRSKPLSFSHDVSVLDTLDLRHYTFGQFPSSVRKDARRIVPHDPNVNVYRGRRGKFTSPFSSHMQFNVPRKVAICVRRKQRREVLFAFRKTGKGARSFRRRNQFSDVRC